MPTAEQASLAKAPPQRGGRDGQQGPGALKDHFDAYRACHARHHGRDPDLEPTEILRFHITASEGPQRRIGKVTEVQVQTESEDYDNDEHADFEACVIESLSGVEFVPPGGTGVARIPIRVPLAGPG